MDELVKRIEELVTSLNYYLYDVVYTKEHKENVLRVMIEKDTEIDLDDCVRVSHALSGMLDEHDPFTEPYNLEVTSSGAERVLHTKEQIKRAVGKMVYIETFDQQVVGELVSYQDGILDIKRKNTKTTKIDEMDVNLIRLTVVL